jgi:hypothetical protein
VRDPIRDLPPRQRCASNQIYKFHSTPQRSPLDPQGLRLACCGFQPTLFSSRDMLPPTKHLRPILKQTSSTLGSPTRSARVHFPPSPRLSTFQFTHSPQLYDRSPLVVQPNVCALPGRGERVYVVEDYDSPTQDDIIRDSIPLREGYLPPERPRDTSTCPHPLSYSPSSGHPESDESDDPPSTPPDPENQSATLLIVTHPMDVLGPSLSRRHSDTDVLGFLPHPPAPGKPKRSKRNVKRPCNDQLSLGCTFSEDGFSTPSFEGCLGGF